jgi:hypothetical protein
MQAEREEERVTMEEERAAMEEEYAARKEMEEKYATMKKDLDRWEEISLKTLLLLQNSDKLTVIKVGSDSSHTQSACFSATADEKPFELSDIDRAHIKELDVSLLLHHAIRVGPLTVWSEADVGVSVHNALMDTLQLLKAAHNLELTIRMERNLFSCRPDPLVVSTRSYSLPLFAIEVKTTSTSRKSWARFSTTQRCLPLLDTSFPFVVISSSEKSVVCWLQDDETATDLDANKSLRYDEADTSSSSTPDKMSKPAEL